MKFSKKYMVVLLATSVIFAFLSCNNNAGTETAEPPHEHTYKTEWSYDETHHWHASDCGHETFVSEVSTHEYKIVFKDGIAYKKCDCGYTLTSTLKGLAYSPESMSMVNDFQNAIKETGAEIATVEKIVFALISDENVKAKVESDAVKATKQDIGTENNLYYAYYDEEEKTVYIVSAQEELKKFVFNKNCNQMFYYFKVCTAIEGLALCDTSNVTNMSYMFSSCTALESIDLSKLDTSNVTNMNSMFYNCTALESIDLSKLDTSNVTNMSGMFSYCTALESLDLSGFDTSNVTDMSSMFYYCTNLATIYVEDKDNFIPDGCTTSNMFGACTKLTSGSELTEKPKP